VNRLCLIVVGVVCTVAVADAQNLSIQSKPARAHAKVATVASSASRSGSLDGIKFSNPYAPPVGSGKTAIAPFPAMLTDDPVEPKDDTSFHGRSRFPGRAYDGRAEAPLLISTVGQIPHKFAQGGLPRAEAIEILARGPEGAQPKSPRIRCPFARGIARSG
jgi:hypothetical protein